MGAFLDKFEGIVLDNSRRVISSLILLAIAVGLVYLVIAALNFTDSPDTENSDPFAVPSFEEPAEITEEEPVQQSESSAGSSTEPQSAAEPDWQHPMPVYRDEIDNILDDLYPLFVAFFNFEVTEDQRRNMVGFTADQLSGYTEVLSKDQMDAVVEGLEDYISDLAGYYAEVAEIDGMEPNEIDPGSMSDPEIERVLNNPFTEYLDGVNESYSVHQEEVDRAEMEARQNNLSALSQISIVGGSVGAMVLLVLLLILFKAENSLRRSADVADGTRVKNS